MKATSLANKFARAMISKTLEMGFQLADISRNGGIDFSAISGERLVLTPEIFGRLCRTTKEMVNDEFYGFTEHHCKLGCLYPFTFETMVREDTLQEALERVFRFYQLVTDDIKFELSQDRDVAKVVVTVVRPDLDHFNYLQEWWLLVWSHTATWLIGEEVPILAVHFPHGPTADIDDYEDAFWGPCQFFQDHGSFEFPAQFLRRRVTRRRDEIPGMFQTPALDLAEVQGINRSYKMLFKAKMKECLFKTESLLSIEDIAEEFKMSSQTVRRRLESDGTSFRALKEEVRREVILAWLAKTDIPIGEVSLRAGFSERNGLTRSVRSWVGLTPSEYRIHVVGAAAVSDTNLHGISETRGKHDLPDALRS